MKRTLISGLALAAFLTTTACGQKEPSAAAAIPAPAQAAPASNSPATTVVAPVAAATALPVLRKAPVWTLKDVDGHEVRSTDFKGKVVIVDFWATWCGPCRHEIPEYVAWQKKYADRGLVILGLSLDEISPAEVKAVGEKLKMNYPILVADGATTELFGGVEALPTAFLIDRDGNIRFTKVGLTDPVAYEKAVLSLL